MILKDRKINPIFETMYFVYVDEIFEGITNDEDLICDIVADATNGIKASVLDDDYPDRVFYDKININRFVELEETVRHINDKVTGNTIMCYNKDERDDIIKQLNALNLEKERAEAKLRAMAL